MCRECKTSSKDKGCMSYLSASALSTSHEIPCNSMFSAQPEPEPRRCSLNERACTHTNVNPTDIHRWISSRILAVEPPEESDVVHLFELNVPGGIVNYFDFAFLVNMAVCGVGPRFAGIDTWFATNWTRRDIYRGACVRIGSCTRCCKRKCGCRVGKALLKRQVRRTKVGRSPWHITMRQSHSNVKPSPMMQLQPRIHGKRMPCLRSGVEVTGRTLQDIGSFSRLDNLDTKA